MSIKRNIKGIGDAAQKFGKGIGNAAQKFVKGIGNVMRKIGNAYSSFCEKNVATWPWYNAVLIWLVMVVPFIVTLFGVNWKLIIFTGLMMCVLAMLAQFPKMDAKRITIQIVLDVVLGLFNWLFSGAFIWIVLMIVFIVVIMLECNNTNRLAERTGSKKTVKTIKGKDGEAISVTETHE